MRTLLAIILSLSLYTFVFADLGVTSYTATAGSGKSVARGCTEVIFDLSGFTGSIGNVSYSSRTVVFAVQLTNAQGQRLSAIPYSVSSGTLNITEVR